MNETNDNGTENDGNAPLLNRNLTIDGVTATVKEWIDRNGVSEWTLRRKLQRGMDIVSAVAKWTHTRTCEVCGRQYESISGRAISCQSCSVIVDSARARLNFAKKRGGPAPTREMTIELARKMYNGEVSCKCGGVKARHIVNVEKSKRTCQACGGEFMAGPDDIYCRPCIREGYDALHEVTGKIYSRRLVKQEGANIVGGWRGRPVAGGNAAKKRDSN